MPDDLLTAPGNFALTSQLKGILFHAIKCAHPSVLLCLQLYALKKKDLTEIADV
jgi:hypothetical protein